MTKYDIEKWEKVFKLIKNEVKSNKLENNNYKSESVSVTIMKFSESHKRK